MGVILLASATLVARVATCVSACTQRSPGETGTHDSSWGTHTSSSVAPRRSATVVTRGFPHLDLTHAPSSGLFGICRHTGPTPAGFFLSQKSLDLHVLSPAAKDTDSPSKFSPTSTALPRAHPHTLLNTRHHSNPPRSWAVERHGGREDKWLVPLSPAGPSAIHCTLHSCSS